MQSESMKHEMNKKSVRNKTAIDQRTGNWEIPRTIHVGLTVEPKCIEVGEGCRRVKMEGQEATLWLGEASRRKVDMTENRIKGKAKNMGTATSSIGDSSGAVN